LRVARTLAYSALKFEFAPTHRWEGDGFGSRMILSRSPARIDARGKLNYEFAERSGRAGIAQMEKITILAGS